MTYGFPMVTVRMTRQEREALKADARKAGVSLNVLARRCLGLMDRPKPTEAGEMHKRPPSAAC